MKKKKTVMVSLFAGIGGFDKAGEEMGWESVVICEIDPICRKVLAYHYPGAYLHGDIKTLTGEIIHHEIEKRLGPGWRSTTRLILVGGFPCQPYSSAGKRLGKNDDRHLWPEMLRVIREAGPDAVVGENVSGILNWNGGLVFDEVQTDLENEGLQVASAVLPACGVNAPHRRDRVWFVANTRRIAGGWRWEDDQSRIRQRHGAGQPQRQEAPDFVEGCHEAQRLVPDPGYKQPPGWKQAAQGQQHDGGRTPRREPSPLGCPPTHSNTTVGDDWPRIAVAAEGQGKELGDGPQSDHAPNTDKLHAHDPGFCPGEVCVQVQAGLQAQSLAAGVGINPGCKRLEGSQLNETPEQGVGGQQPPRPASELRETGHWDDWPTQSPVYSGDDGFPTGLGDSRVQFDPEALEASFGKADPRRMEGRLNKFGLKASGNAIVWQVVFQVFKALEATWED